MRAAGSPPFTAGPVLPLSDLHRLCPSSQVGPAHDTGASPVPAVRARASSAAQTGRHRMLADWNGLAPLRALLPQIKTHRKHRKEPGNLTALIASIPQAACGTQDTSYPSRGAQGRAEGAGRERQPSPPFLPALRPGLGPGLRVGATWLFRGEAEGRVSGRGATGTAEGRRPPFKALGRPGSWQPRTAEGQAITLRGTENQGISLATDVRRADSTFRAGPKRRNNCGNSKHYQHWSIYALMGSGWFYRSAILRKLPTLTCGKGKETGEGALISTQVQHWKGGSLLKEPPVPGFVHMQNGENHMFSNCYK